MVRLSVSKVDAPKQGIRASVARPVGSSGSHGDAHDSAAEVAPPPRLQRRPLVVLVSLALVVLGAVVSVWAYSSVGTAQEVVAVRVDIGRGRVITASALRVVRVGVDPALSVVPASGLDGLVGQRASVDLKAGQLVVPAAVTADVVPHAGDSVVGLSLGEGQMPVDALVVGDQVRVVSTPGQQGDVVAADIRVFQGSVVSVSPPDSSRKVAMVVEVPEAQAAELAARAATGKLAVVVDARGK